jgi:hypothetical protein
LKKIRDRAQARKVPGVSIGEVAMVRLKTQGERHVRFAQTDHPYK